MQKIFCMLQTLAALTAAIQAHAGTFSDSLTNGINPTLWTVHQTTPNMYSVTANSSGVTF